MQVVPQLDPGPAMFQRLQAAITHQASSGPLLERPEAKAQRSLVPDLLCDLPRDVRARVTPDPPRHERVQVNLRERVEVVPVLRAVSKTRGLHGEQGHSAGGNKPSDW
jgi:hypothetical protein